MATVNSILENSMKDIFKLIVDKYSGEDFNVDDLMKLMTEDISTSDSDTEAAMKKKKTKKEQKKKDENMPKKPPSSYIMFCNETRGTKPNGNGRYSKDELNELWKDLDKNDKDIWQNKAKEMREKWQEDVENYKKTKMAEGGNSDSE
jgi:hypothetical protein